MGTSPTTGKKRSLKVAIVHDWLTGMRGGEVVLEALLDLFEGADLYTLMHDKGSVSSKITSRNVYCSFIDKLPFKNKFYRHYLPLFPMAIEGFDFQGYDLVFSSSHCVARGIKVPPGVVHLSYIHSPMRYVWDMQNDYFPAKGFFNKLIIPFFMHYLRMWDYTVRDRVDRYICNSQFVAQRVKRFYGKSAQVIFPPCLDKKISLTSSNRRESYFLVLSALVPYKRIDLVIETFRQIPEEKLIIVGTGPELKRLKKMASPNVEFKGKVERMELENFYKNASALLFPGMEDFGIVPIEAQSFGCPVIAFNKGGALETVIHKKTGYLFDKQSVESLLGGIAYHKNALYKSQDFVKNVSAFTLKKFDTKIKKEVQDFFPGWR